MVGEAALAAVLPGWSARRRSTPVSVGLLVLGCGVPLAVVAYALGMRRSWVALSLDAGLMRLVVVGAAAAIAARLIAVGEVWFAHGAPRGRDGRTLAALGLTMGAIAPFGYAAVEAAGARRELDAIFSADLDVPLWNSNDDTGHPDVVVPATRPPDTTTAPTTPPEGTYAVGRPLPDKVTSPGADPTQPLSECPTSHFDPVGHEGVATILLLGGDAGPGRWSLRTDTMMLFSVHQASGRASLVSVPRNLMRLRFPPGTAMAERFPTGFTDLANAVYPVVQSRPELREAYSGVPGVDPGVVALAEGLGCSLDVTIDDYVLIDMRGFVDLVDAVGGVTLDVPQAVPMPGYIPGQPDDYPRTIGPGQIHMNGSTALGYVRSRSADSDYARTARQRLLLAALASQVGAGDVMGAYGRVIDALGDALRTSLSPDELADTLAVIGGDTAIVESVGLVPPVVNVNQPNWPELAQIVADVQAAVATGTPSRW